MHHFITTDKWHQTFPGGHVGIMLLDRVRIDCPTLHLNKKKRKLEACLKEKYDGFSRAQLLADPILKAYKDYYKKFKKTYHVQLQLESVALKNKTLPDTIPLVDANFAAELETLTLTAGHDADLVGPALTIDASGDDQSFIQMNGTCRSLKPDDMIMVDNGEIICSIIYGQDQRTAISRNTTRPLYVTYAPPGVPLESVKRQMETILENIRLFDPNVGVAQRSFFSA